MWGAGGGGGGGGADLLHVWGGRSSTCEGLGGGSREGRRGRGLGGGSIILM